MDVTGILAEVARRPVHGVRMWRACMAKERAFFDSEATRDRADLVVRAA
jgi:hypothetical protein